MVAFPKPIRSVRPAKPKAKRQPLKKVSSRQTKELALRSKLKSELMNERPEINGVKVCPQTCPNCDRIHIPWPGYNLIHKKPLSRGGKTTRDNVELGCQEYHNIKYHGARYGHKE